MMSLFRPWASIACLAAVAGWLVGQANPAGAQEGARHLTMLGIPSATVAPHGTGYVTLQYGTERPGPGTGPDASLAFGVGFGDAERTLGVEITTEVTSITDDFADSGYANLRFSRRIAAGPVPAYLGLEIWRLGAWGDARGLDPAANLTVTLFPTIDTPRGPAPLMVSFGAGTDVRANQTRPGAYAGVGFGLSPEFAVSAAWYGDHATIGASFAPRRMPNVQFKAALVDVFDNTGDQRAVFAVTMLFPKVF